MKITILGTLPSLNEIINTSKKNKYAYEKMKHEAINSVVWGVKQSIKRPYVHIPIPSDFVITWIRPDKRTDKDNIQAGQKFIFDALQEIGLMSNDGWKEIGDIAHKFDVDKKNPRVEIEIREAS